MSTYKIFNEDCIEFLKSSDIISQCKHVVVDLPYYKVVEADFDNQWKSETEYLDWVDECFGEISKKIKPFGNIIVFTARQYNRHVCNILDKYFTEKRIIIWARKRAFNNTRGKALASGYEPVCYYVNREGTDNVFNNIKVKVDSNRPEYKTGFLKDGVSLSDVWSDIPALPHNSKEKVNHPTQKPIRLMERIIEVFTDENDTVLDFCMGSRSTGIACLNKNRNFVGIEKYKQYFDIADERLRMNSNKNQLF